jgi:thioredoxin-like negative regulator of GroEL
VSLPSSDNTEQPAYGQNSAARAHAHNTDAYKVNVDEFPSAKENLKLTTFPAVVVFKDGKEIKRVEGVNKDNAKDIVEVLV